tara:strand:- start:2821 stop:4440 length:1620 start_codon:yes stop_codon:yes gene_type:complete
MAINFYDDISLDGQQLLDASVDVVASQTGQATYQGRIIFNQTTSALEYFDGSDWISLDGTGNVDSVTAGIGLYNSGSPSAVVMEVGYGGSNPNIVTDATGSGTLATTSRILVSNGNSVKDYPISNLATLLASGVSSITTTDTAFIDMTPTTATSGAVTLTAALSATGTPSSTTFLRGNNTWHTPASNSDTTYTLPVTNGASPSITLVAGGSGSGTVSTVNFGGTGNQLVATGSGTDTITYSLPSAVVAPGSIQTGLGVTVGTTLQVTGATTLQGTLDVTGVATFTAIPTMPSSGTSAATDAASKAYVDSVVSGGLIFQGSYDASSTGPNSSALQGWTYAVSVGGTGGGYWSPALEEGDLIIAESNNPSAQASWTILQNNVVLATNSTEGIAMFEQSKGFAATVTAGSPALIANTVYSGTTTASQVPIITTSQWGTVTNITNQAISIASTDVTDFGTAAQTQINTNTLAYTITGDGTDVSFPTPGAGHSIPAGLDVSVQVYAVSGGATVYPRIERTSTTNVNVIFKTAPANGTAFKVLLF